MIESMTTFASPSKIKNKKLKFIVEKQGSGLQISDKMGEISHGGSKLEHIISFLVRAYDRNLAKKKRKKKGAYYRIYDHVM